MTALSAALPVMTPSTPATMATIEDFPTEIMTMILETTHLARRSRFDPLNPMPILGDSDVLTLRRSTRRLESTTFDPFVRRFFKSRKYILCQWSMQCLADLVAHPRLGPHIKELAFVPECPRCSAMKHRCKDCDRNGRRALVSNWSRKHLLLPVNMNTNMWLDTCSRMKVLKFYKTWPGPYGHLGQFEQHWIDNVLTNCENLVELILLNELAADQMLKRVNGNSLRRLTLGSGCRIQFSALGTLLQQHVNSLEEIKITGVQLQCHSSCQKEDSDDHEDAFLSWISMFKLMLQMPHLKAIQFDTLMQMYHGYHEPHMRSNIHNVHTNAIAEHRCLVVTTSDVTTKLQLAIDHSFTVRIPDGSTTGEGKRTVQVLLP